MTIAAFAIVFLLVTGIIAGFVGDWWGERWIWASIAILVLLWAYMSFRGHAVPRRPSPRRWKRRRL